MDVKANAAQQALLLARESNMRCFCSQKLLKHEKFKDQKKFKAKKNYSLAANSNNGNSNQSGQALGRFSKKNSCLNKRDQQNQSSNTLTTGNNSTISKNDKK